MSVNKLERPKKVTDFEAYISRFFSRKSRQFESGKGDKLIMTQYLSVFIRLCWITQLETGRDLNSLRTKKKKLKELIVIESENDKLYDNKRSSKASFHVCSPKSFDFNFNISLFVITSRVLSHQYRGKDSIFVI